MLSTLAVAIDWNPLIRASAAGVLIFVLMAAVIVLVALAKDVDCVPRDTSDETLNLSSEMTESRDAAAA